MFERFTDDSRRAIVLAQDAARQLNHNYIGTEHLLLGLIKLGQGTAFVSLDALGFTYESVQKRVEELVGIGNLPGQADHIPFTPYNRNVLEHSLREAIMLRKNYIDTEHLLLAIIHQGEGVAASILEEHEEIFQGLCAHLESSVASMSEEPTGYVRVGPISKHLKQLHKEQGDSPAYKMALARELEDHARRLRREAERFAAG